MSDELKVDEVVLDVVHVPEEESTITEETATEKPKKSKKKVEEVKLAVKLLSKRPDEEGYYRVRYVGNGEKRVYKVKADTYPYSYATQYLSPDELHDA